VRSFLAEVDAKLKAVTKSVPIQQHEVASYPGIIP
jgi:hypothetical protein